MLRRSIRMNMNHITPLRIKAFTIIKKNHSTKGTLKEKQDQGTTKAITTKTLITMPSNNTPSTKKLSMLSDLPKRQALTLNTKIETLLTIKPIKLNRMILKM